MIHLFRKCWQVSLLLLLSYQYVFAQNNNIVVKEIRLGDNVLSILRNEGFSESERETALGKSEGLHEMFLTLDLKYAVQKSKTKTEVLFFEQQKNLAYRVSRSKAGVSVEEFKPKFKTSIKRFEGLLSGSIFGTAFELSKSNWVSSRVHDAFIMTHSSEDLDRGTKFWFEVEKKYLNGKFIRYGEVTRASAEFDEERVTKTLLRLEDGSTLFANLDDLSSKHPLYAPVDYIKISSVFQPRRRHPVTGRVQAHLGVDFELPEGANIFSAKSGRVIRAGYNHAAGNFVVLQHANGIQTSYNHMSSVSSVIRVGNKVKNGELLGKVGCTGYCTRAHLHFAVKVHGRIVDPLRFVRTYPIKAEENLVEYFGAKKKLFAATE